MPVRPMTCCINIAVLINLLDSNISECNMNKYSVSDTQIKWILKLQKKNSVLLKTIWGFALGIPWAGFNIIAIMGITNSLTPYNSVYQHSIVYQKSTVQSFWLNAVTLKNKDPNTEVVIVITIQPLNDLRVLKG